MVRCMSAKEARDNFADVLGTAYYKGEPVIVEKKGKPFAVVISPQQYEQYEQIRKDQEQALWKVVDELRERNRDKDPDDVLREVTEIVEEVRQERYDRGV